MLRDDMSDSAFDFQRVVWPAVASACGGGQLIPVESVMESGFAQQLDILAGIDAWQVLHGAIAMRGIASRVQWTERCWGTFTVRRSLRSGRETEYHKRLRALENRDRGFLLPHLTIQAYVTKRRTGSLVGAAVAPTEQVIRMCTDDTSYVQTNGHDGNTFFVVDWNAMQAHGCTIRIVEPEAA